MPDAAGALSRDRPHVEREREEVVRHHRAGVRQAGGGPLLHVEGAVEAALAGHDHPLGDVAQHGVGRAAERPPRARAARPLALLPDQLAAQQQAEVVLQDADHVGRQAAVGLAPEVGDVDSDATAGFELAHALGEHVGEHLQVLEVRRRHALALELFLVDLAGEVRRRGDHEGDRAVDDGVHVAGVAAHERVGHGGGRQHRGVVGQLGGAEPVVERRGVVVLARRDPEVRGGRTAARLVRSFRHRPSFVVPAGRKAGVNPSARKRPAPVRGSRYRPGHRRSNIRDGPASRRPGTRRRGVRRQP